MIWDKYKKPPPDICPEAFCFLWSELDKKCRETFGKCRRCAANLNNKDWYEPHEPELKRHGLPWFYFIANGETLANEQKEKYLKESSKLWEND